MSERKPWVSLVVAVLVADLVFLRLLWSVTSLAATYWVERMDETAVFCEGQTNAVPEEEGADIRAATVKSRGTRVDGCEVVRPRA